MLRVSNIDTRIQQAELQYQLGREELELLTLGEQARALAQLIQHASAAAHHDTLYRSYILIYLLYCILYLLYTRLLQAIIISLHEC